MLTPEIFQNLLLEWFSKYGRKHLPWQHPRLPYRVWLSEVMLQQTQVNTVIPYFERFIQRFPDVYSLAEAPLDDVLHLWAGLGYYARARHLHQAAQKIVLEYNGHFPHCLEDLQRLPGIGRSTAGAILSLGFNQPAPILDGNVKRVLTRLHAIDGWPALPHINKQLWAIATDYLPKTHASDYTQASMDFGSLICVRRKPLCHQCPFNAYCLAHIKAQVEQYPTPKPNKRLPVREIKFLILINAKKEVLLEKRPPTGIWGGLWSLPECAMETNVQEWCQTHYQCTVENAQTYPFIQHTFSHFQLKIQPIVCKVTHQSIRLHDNKPRGWYTHDHIHYKGLAAPVKKLLHHLETITHAS
jgi:A/G-specific adenine glycosylase